MKFREFRQGRPLGEIFVDTLRFFDRDSVCEIFIWRAGEAFEARLRCGRWEMIAPRRLGLDFGELLFTDYCPSCDKRHRCMLGSSPGLIQALADMPEGVLLKVRHYIDTSSSDSAGWSREWPPATATGGSGVTYHTSFQHNVEMRFSLSERLVQWLMYHGLSYRYQQELDSLALGLYESLKEGICPSFFLFLRPFSLDRAPFESIPPWFPWTKLTERRLAMVLLRFGTPIALAPDMEEYLKTVPEPIGLNELNAREPRTLGAGRLPVKAREWRTRVMELAAAARGIIVFPMPSKAVHWELRLLERNRSLSKTVFVQPPRSLISDEEWQVARSRAERFAGLKLPAFHRRGRLFALTTTGELGDSAPLTTMTPGALRRSLARLLRITESHHSP